MVSTAPIEQNANEDEVARAVEQQALNLYPDDRESFVASARSEPATEKQKEKLRYFGYPLKDGMTKGEASDAIDEYVRRFPERDR